MLDRDLISPGRIFSSVRINSKKRLLQLIAATLAKKNKELNSREIFQSFCDRENLGSTALGNGVAIPHGRISGTEEVEALFLQLVKPLSYEADDGQPVDLVFALIVPQDYTEEREKLLSSTAERFSDADFLKQLRGAEDANEIWQLLSNAQ